MLRQQLGFVLSEYTAVCYVMLQLKSLVQRHPMFILNVVYALLHLEHYEMATDQNLQLNCLQYYIHYAYIVSHITYIMLA